MLSLALCARLKEVQPAHKCETGISLIISITQPSISCGNNTARHKSRSPAPRLMRGSTSPNFPFPTQSPLSARASTGGALSKRRGDLITPIPLRELEIMDAALTIVEHQTSINENNSMKDQCEVYEALEREYIRARSRSFESAKSRELTKEAVDSAVAARTQGTVGANGSQG